MTNAERIVSAAHAALDPGPMGATLRPFEYRAFIACGFAPPLATPFESSDFGTIKTSCGIFARAVLHSAGRKATRPGRVGQGLLGGWLERLTTSHLAWEGAVGPDGKRRRPPPGALFYRDYSKNFSSIGHVGFLLFETSPGLWVTAEGGGGDGTRCAISASPKDFFAKDSLNRVPQGWFRPELLDGFVELPSAPFNEPPGSPVEPSVYAHVRLGDRDPAGSTAGPVRSWQRRLVTSGVSGATLPKYGADGDFGGETLAATRALITARLDGSDITQFIWDLAEQIK